MTPQELLAHHDAGTLWPHTPEWPSVAQAYQLALQTRALRMARGEQPVGYKIGFTNRSIWPRYGVYAPIWGPVWSSTLTRGGSAEGVLSLAGTCQPRLEPEIVFGLRATPPAQPTLQQVFECVQWLAPGFEVVQSHLPDWRFEAAHTVADGGLHARLFVGAEQPVRALAEDGAALAALLAGARVQLRRDGQRVEEGLGAQVLDSPLHALRHFILELQACPGAPTLQPGEVVTTGTWTDAWPVQPGQQWEAQFDAPLGAVRVRMA